MAGAAVRDRFNKLTLQVSERDLLDDLVDRAMDLNSDEPILAASYYGSDGVGLVNLVVDSYGDEAMPRPSREEVQPLLLQIGNGDIVGEPEVSHVDLAAGPAIRVKATVKTRRMLGLGRRLGEFIKYAVFPPGIKQLVVVTANWQDIAHTDELSRATDELVWTMRNVPLDADGREIFPGAPE